jgi:hypothetical protein
MFIALAVIVIFIIIAAICNAIMDTLWHHYDKSIFGDLNPMFWNPKVSWRLKYKDHKPTEGRIKWDLGLFKINKPSAISDAWHIFKTANIISLISAISIAFLNIPIETPLHSFLDFLILTTVLGTLRNYTFSLFYDKILLK